MSAKHAWLGAVQDRCIVQATTRHGTAFCTWLVRVIAVLAANEAFQASCTVCWQIEAVQWVSSQRDHHMPITIFYGTGAIATMDLSGGLLYRSDWLKQGKLFKYSQGFRILNLESQEVKPLKPPSERRAVARSL